MNQVKELLEAREQYLKKLKNEKEQALLTAPKGSLRICHSKNRTQFYKRDNPKDFNGIYLKDKEVAKKLAQKDYDQKVIRSIEKELKAIQRYLADYPIKNVEDIYDNLHKERKKLVTPIHPTEEQYVESWKRVIYRGKEFYPDSPEFYTSRGERVRSKSEVIIADVLNREGIPYRYECPLYFKGIGYLYPDFTVLNVRTRKEFFWEHLGMMDDSNYSEQTVQKILQYERQGIYPGETLLLTYETRKTPLNQKQIMMIIQKYLI